MRRSSTAQHPRRIFSTRSSKFLLIPKEFENESTYALSSLEVRSKCSDRGMRSGHCSCAAPQQGSQPAWARSVLRHDVRRAQHDLRPAEGCRSEAAGLHSAEPTRLGKLRATGGVSSSRDYSSQEHGCSVPGTVRSNASTLPVADN